MSNNFYTDDIQTGRNVYVDKDLYESDESYKTRVDSYVKEGFALVFGTPDNPSSGGGGGGSSRVHPVQVTIINNTEDTVNLIPSISNDNPESGYSGGFYISDTGITEVSSNTEWLPSLLKDTTTVLSPAYCLDDGVIYITDFMGEHYTYTLSENATKTEIQGMDVIVVTGDCTITIS